jgi:hypothetical protein
MPRKNNKSSSVPPDDAKIETVVLPESKLEAKFEAHPVAFPDIPSPSLAADSLTQKVNGQSKFNFFIATIPGRGRCAIAKKDLAAGTDLVKEHGSPWFIYLHSVSAVYQISLIGACVTSIATKHVISAGSISHPALCLSLVLDVASLTTATKSVRAMTNPCIKWFVLHFRFSTLSPAPRKRTSTS